MNYRLGALGFLSAMTSVYPGNLALSDIGKADEWVQNNIQHFGGDYGDGKANEKDRYPKYPMTIVGHGCGALAVSLLQMPTTYTREEIPTT
ncbi:hypothetical protein JTE90_024791 [Oedothorax gibbosus]|uniref:Carboxylesterase type B domain-containing protein n=1 Tax=Oedothorax gibbosus TaxID=931172 RepID=A0AAV6TPG2_9ARAC|nr:hypothetical protein JTE90_024791 [Oedothorax gibbosus]